METNRPTQLSRQTFHTKKIKSMKLTCQCVPLATMRMEKISNGMQSKLTWGKKFKKCSSCQTSIILTLRNVWIFFHSAAYRVVGYLFGQFEQQIKLHNTHCFIFAAQANVLNTNRSNAHAQTFPASQPNEWAQKKNKSPISIIFPFHVRVCNRIFIYDCFLDNSVAARSSCNYFACRRRTVCRINQPK